MVDGAGIGTEDADRLIAHLPAMAVRAVEEVAAPTLSRAGNVGKLIDGAGREKEPSCCHRAAPSKPERETRFDLDDLVFDDLDAVAPDFFSRQGEKVGRWHPVPREETLHVCGRSVPRRSGVDDNDAAPRAAENEGGAQTGRTTADHGDVMSCCIHGLDGAREARRPQDSLLFLGTASSVASVANSSPIPDVLAEVGPRLKRLRTKRGVTLTALAAQTGISKSTLSRLESGQRKPSLELLLPLAEAHQVPLGELVGAPDVGDPRIRLQPRVRNGRMVFPLTQQSSGLQVWKVVIPPERERELRTHEGYEWLYVLSGEVRLIIGEHDITMGPGEVAEFDTRLPHWFGPAGDEPVEILSIHGSQGQRMHVRAAPRRKTNTA